MAEARELYRQAGERAPDDVSYLIGFGDFLRASGRVDEAVTTLRKAVSLSPKLGPLYEHISMLLLSLGRQAEAEEALRRGLAENPGSASLLRNMGSFLSSSGRSEAGIEYLCKAVEANPESSDLRVDLGNLLIRMRRYAEAEAEYRKALELSPNDLGVINNIGGALRHQFRLAEAEAVYRDALGSFPDDPDLNGNLAGALLQMGRVGEAKTFYARALALRSPWPGVHSNLVLCLDFDEEAGLAEQAAARRHWQEVNEAPFLGTAAPFQAPPDPDRKVLRVGYVSADFNWHSASDGFGPVLLNHDRASIHATLYSCSHVEDQRTQEFIARADRFRRVHLLSDDDLAALIRKDGIDILVDLSGHSAGNRLPVFARRPAPVQATGWGYATSTGMLSMDYLLADRWLVPWENRDFYTEEIVELPCVLSFRLPENLPAVGPAPCQRNGFITFGSFNRLAKASDACLRSWARLLLAVPDSRLLIKSSSLVDPTLQQRLLDLFGESGIGPERLELRGESTRLQQLVMHNEVDICLDTFRHCGGVTTCEALAMGVPVVTLCGDVPVARNGASILAGLGCPEWITGSVDAYIETICGLAADPDRLAAIRAGLRQLLLASPLGDNAGYARQVESAYRRMWVRYCMGLRGGVTSAR